MIVKQWFEKEQDFETRYRNGTHCRNLWKYIPRNKLEAVDDATVDSDGYWVYLADGWTDDGDRVIHAYTVKDIVDAVKNVKKEAE